MYLFTNDRYMMTFGLFLLLLYHLDLTGACTVSNNAYTVSSGQTCTISSSITADVVQVNGKLIVNGNPSEGTVPGIYAKSLYVGSNGIITADGQGYSSESGPGSGTSKGSGGKNR